MTLRTAYEVLSAHGLLREVVSADAWYLDAAKLPDLTFTGVSYDTRTVTPSTLLFCKGRFRAEYLTSANELGLRCYVAETEYSEASGALGLIVNDIHQAMALLSAQFYGNPQNELFVVGITGTKGKTTTAYFTHAILKEHTGNKTALMSSESTCLDGVHSFESNLTTPESLDLFRMMRQARDAGMTHLVMEVSSQAYKTNRVYGITFDVGAFLNISPDHISPIEHPTFEDYFYCKRRLLQNSHAVVINAGIPQTELLRQTAEIARASVATFELGCGTVGNNLINGSDAATEGTGTAGGDPDTTITSVIAAPIAAPLADDSAVASAPPATPESIPAPLRITGSGVTAEGCTFIDETAHTVLGTFHLSIEGDFNYANALAGVTIARVAGVKPNESAAFHALDSVVVPGRMERFTTADGIVAYVDYAHNYISLKSLIDFAHEYHPGARVTVVTGSAGGKALDRRQGMAQAASEGADSLILTPEDSDFEDPHAISVEMAQAVTNPNLAVAIIDDRETAIRTAFAEARQYSERENVVLVIGKGAEKWVKIKGKHVPYASDETVVKSIVNEGI